LKEEMLAQQEEVAGARVREVKEEIAIRLSAFLQVHESLGKEGAREKIGSEEVIRIKGIYQDLKSGDASALDNLTEFNSKPNTQFG
jgi:8-oxo-dGTP pyrophosphatase MutT (NUDIX family)